MVEEPAAVEPETETELGDADADAREKSSQDITATHVLLC